MDMAGAALSKTGIFTVSKNLVASLRASGVDVVEFAPTKPVDGRTYLPWFHCVLPHLVNRASVEAMVYPANMLPLVVPATVNIVLLHDVIWESFPNDYNLVWRIALRYGALHALKNAKVISPSQWTADAVLKRFGRHVSMVLPYQFRRTPRKADAVKNQSRDVVYVGSLVGHKNVETLIRGFENIASSFPGAVLHIVGDGPYRQHLERLSQQLVTSRQIVFHGFISEERKKALLSAARVFVQPSLEEGFSLTPWEASALGADLVLSAIPAHEVFREFAWCFRPGSPEDCARALFSCLTTEPGQPLHREFSGEFNIDNYAEEIKRIATWTCVI